MVRVTRRALGVAALGGGLVLAGAMAGAQTAAPAATTGKGAVIGTGTFTAFVENMDRSLAFFHDVFGMEVPPLPESGQRPYNRANPQLFAMFDIPGARERHQSARVSGTRVNVELMEIQDVEHRTVPLRVQDPGAATLVLIVRDLDATLARVKQANVTIATPGQKPVTVGDGVRAVLIRDLDNRFIELRQPAAAAAAASTSDIIDLRLSIAVTDLDRTTRLYRDVLGFSRVQAPGSNLWIEFVEYTGVDRTPIRARIQDRGAARLQLRVQNITDMVSTMKHAGMTVVSQGGGPVPIPPNFMGALVGDFDNFFVTPFEPAAK